MQCTSEWHVHMSTCWLIRKAERVLTLKCVPVEVHKAPGSLCQWPFNGHAPIRAAQTHARAGKQGAQGAPLKGRAQLGRQLDRQRGGC